VSAALAAQGMSERAFLQNALLALHPLQIPTAQSGEVYLDLKSIHLSPLQSQGRAVPICSEIRPSGCLYIRETEIRDDINILFLL